MYKNIHIDKKEYSCFVADRTSCQLFNHVCKTQQFIENSHDNS